MRIMLKSKIIVKVTDVNIEYEGSITIDEHMMKLVDIVPYEQVHVLNVTNGNRIITYAIIGDKDEICINGAAAKKFDVGDKIIILAYEIGNVSSVKVETKKFIEEN